jgi:hypothetical protein
MVQYLCFNIQRGAIIFIPTKDTKDDEQLAKDGSDI